MARQNKNKPVHPNPHLKTAPASPTLAAQGEFQAPEVAAPAVAPTTPVATSPQPATPTAATSTVDFADGPPTVTLPSVATGFTAPSLRAFMAYRLTSLEALAMPSVVKDLGNADALETSLGPTAPGASAILAKVTVGMQWRALRDEVDAFETYVKVADAMAWKSAVTALDKLEPFFAAAVAANPELAATFPGLTAYFSARSGSAKQGVATKKKKAKTVAQKAAASAASAAVPVAPAPAPKVTITTT
jgi:hypothetical protein